MESELKTWALAGVVTVLAVLLGFVIKVVTAQVIKRLDEIVIELKQLSHATTIQGQEIKGLQERDVFVNSRLSEHAERILSLEKAHINH